MCLLNYPGRLVYFIHHVANQSDNLFHVGTHEADTRLVCICKLKHQVIFKNMSFSFIGLQIFILFHCHNFSNDLSLADLQVEDY